MYLQSLGRLVAPLTSWGPLMLVPSNLSLAARPLAAALLATLLLSAPLAAVETLRPAGSARPVDGILDCDGREPSVAVLGGGGFVAAWIGAGSVWSRRLDSTGVPFGEPIALASGIELAEPDVVARADGGFAVVWLDGAADRVHVRTATATGVLAPVLVAGEVGSGATGLDAAIMPSGNVAIAWSEATRLWLRELRPDGTWAADAALLVEGTLFPPSVQSPFLHDPAVVGMPDGSLFVFFVSSFGQTGGTGGSLNGRRVGPLTPGGTYPEPTSVEVPGTGIDQKPAVVAAVQGGGFLLTWLGDFSLNFPILPIPMAVVLAARYDDEGKTGSEAVIVDDAGHAYEHVAATVTPDGRFVVAWDGTHGLEPGRPRAFAATLDPTGNPEGAAVAIADEASWGQEHPALAAGAGGLVLSAWQEVEDPAIVHIRCPGERIRARALLLECGADGTLCVGGGRFALSLELFDPGRAVPRQRAPGALLTADTGYFWLTAPDNVEVVVKVLDGRGVNGHYWVFYGGLTDIGFELTVRDTLTGRERRFVNPPGTMASAGVTDALLPSAAPGAAAEVADLRAFSAVGLARDAFPGEGPGPEAGALSPPPPPTPCQVPTQPGLCLNGERFGVMVTWRAFDGSTGFGHGVELGDDSGYFWFFHPDNIELVVKVLDGRAVNGKYWVFYGALSNVEYSIDIRHVLDDWLQWPTYVNPLGHFASVADTEAFDPPGEACVCPAVVDPVCGRDGRTYGNECEAYCLGWVAIAHEGPCQSP